MEYSDDLAAAICERIAQGESLRTICRDADMPSMRAVFNWLARYPDFVQQYTRARNEQAENYADDIVRIADEEQDPAKARVRIDARKWVAAKLLPKKYGDRQTIEGGEAPIKIETSSPLEQARKVAFALALGLNAKDD